MPKQIDIQDLQPGMVIVRITKQNGPIKIKKSGLVTSQDMVQGLIEMGIQQVEVDPDQTVEVEAPKIKKSATRRMLESNEVTNTRIDDGLSEQFNRSLFLPSAQSIPTAWQFYTKRYLLAAFIALGGLGFGWTLANYQSVLAILSSPPDDVVVNISAPAQTPIAPVPEQLEDNSKLSSEVDELQNKQSEKITNLSKQPLNVPDEIKSSSELTPERSEVTQAVVSSPEPEVQISADVLARFRKAITEVADSPVSPAPAENTSSNDDVLRVDQVPPWVMNRLPSMAFSAHMYASVQSERWVRVNGIRMVEGDKIDDMVEIVRIEPQHVILNYLGQEFSMAALTDW